MSAMAVLIFVVSVLSAGESLTGSTAPDAQVVAEAQTTAVTALALFQVFYLVTCRTLTEPVRRIGWWSNPWLFVGIGALLLLQAGFVYVPFMQDLFRTAPLSASQWGIAALAGAVIVPVVTLEKWLRRRSSHAKHVRAHVDT